MKFNDREEIIALTPQWKGERLPDGRPKVEEKYLKAYLKQYKGYKYPNNISNVYPEFYY